MARGRFYGEAVSPDAERPGVSHARQVARQAPTARVAAIAVETSEAPRGYVQEWSDRTQSRTTVATFIRGEGWHSVDPFTGERVAVTW